MRMIVQLEEMIVLDLDDEEDLEDYLEEVEEDDELPASVVRVLLTPDQARAFCDVADMVVSSGRPPCRWCGAPLDPSGHACPKMN